MYLTSLAVLGGLLGGPEQLCHMKDRCVDDLLRSCISPPSMTLDVVQEPRHRGSGFERRVQKGACVERADGAREDITELYAVRRIIRLGMRVQYNCKAGRVIRRGRVKCR